MNSETCYDSVIQTHYGYTFLTASFLIICFSAEIAHGASHLAKFYVTPDGVCLAFGGSYEDRLKL